MQTVIAIGRARPVYADTFIEQEFAPSTNATDNLLEHTNGHDVIPDTPNELTANDILQSWGMGSLPSLNMAQLVNEEHAAYRDKVFAAETARLQRLGLSPRQARKQAHATARQESDYSLGREFIADEADQRFREVFGAERERLRSEGVSRRRARKLAFVAAKQDRDGAGMVNELGLKSELDEERFIPGSFKDRTQQLLLKMQRRSSHGVGVLGKLKYYAGEVQNGFISTLTPRQRKAAAVAGVCATAVTMGVGYANGVTEGLSPVYQGTSGVIDSFFDQVNTQQSEIPVQNP